MSLSEVTLPAQQQLVSQRNLQNRFLRDYTVEVWLSAAVGDRRQLQVRATYSGAQQALRSAKERFPSLRSRVRRLGNGQEPNPDFGQQQLQPIAGVAVREEDIDSRIESLVIQLADLFRARDGN